MSSIYENLNALISLDVESAGPVPSEYALLSIGACTVARPRRTFYVELVPDKEKSAPDAEAVHGLSLDTLRRTGLPAEEAMQKLADWLAIVIPGGVKPIMLAFNAPFDWMFIHDYFIRYLGYNPFGHSAVDIKAVYMGASGKSWQETSGENLHRLYHHGKELSHNALEDAIDQSMIFEEILKDFYKPENSDE